MPIFAVVRVYNAWTSAAPSPGPTGLLGKGRNPSDAPPVVSPGVAPPFVGGRWSGAEAGPSRELGVFVSFRSPRPPLCGPTPPQLQGPLPSEARVPRDRKRRPAPAFLVQVHLGWRQLEKPEAGCQ